MTFQLPDYLCDNNQWLDINEELFDRVISQCEREAQREARAHYGDNWLINDAIILLKRLDKEFETLAQFYTDSLKDTLSQAKLQAFIHIDTVETFKTWRLEVMQLNAKRTYLDTFILFASDSFDSNLSASFDIYRAGV